MSTNGLLFQRASTIKNPSKSVGIVQSGYHYILVDMHVVLAMIYLKIDHLALNNNHSLGHLSLVKIGPR